MQTVRMQQFVRLKVRIAKDRKREFVCRCSCRKKIVWHKVTAKAGYGKGSCLINFVLRKFVLDKVHIPELIMLKLVRDTTQP